MHRSWLLVLGLLFISAFGFSQSTSSDSQGMQALVAEVRQLRMDLRATNGNSLKAQILLQRLQVQETTLARVSQRVNDLRSQLAATQEHQRSWMNAMKHYEKLADSSEISPTERKEAEDQITGLKRELQSVAAEEQLRVEQAKLDGLEDRVEQLEKALGGNPQ